MLRLVLHTNVPKFTELDTKDVSLQLNFLTSDISTLGRATNSHSLAFKLPFTDTNNVAIGYFEELDNTVDTRLTKRCDVYDDGTLVFEGRLQVRSCDLQSRTYDCVVYSLESAIWQLLKTSTWQQVFSYAGVMTTALDHDHNSENIAKSNLKPETIYESNDITDGQVGNDVIWYPWQYNCQRVTGDEQTYALNLYTAQGVTSTSTRWCAFDFLPFIRVKYLMEQVFLHCGYTLDTTDQIWDDNELEWLYQSITRENLSYRPYFSPTVSGYDLIGDTGGIFLGDNLPSNYSFKSIVFAEYLTGDSDLDNLFGGQAFGAFNPPVQGTYNMRIHLEWTWVSTPILTNYDYVIGVQPYDIITAQPAGTQQIFQRDQDDPLSIDIDFQYTGSTTSDQAIVPVLLFTSPAGSQGFVFTPSLQKLTMTSYVGDSPKVSVPNSLGSDTVDKWLKAMIAQFNLVLLVDEDEGSVRLQRKVKFFDTDISEAKDWSDKVDIGKPMVVTNNLERIQRLVHFLDAEGDDGKNKWLQDQYDQRFTEYEYKSELPLAKGEEKVGDYFAPARYTYLPTNTTGVSWVFDFSSEYLGRGIQSYARSQDDQVDLALNKKPVLVFKGDQRDLTFYSPYPLPRIYDNTQFYLQTANIPYTTISEYTEPKPYGKFTGSGVRFLLSWNKRGSYDGFALGGIASTFDYAYKKEMDERYDKGARNLECTVHLTSSDIRDLSYNDIIAINGVYYYIDTIQNYAVGANLPCKLKLRKLLETWQVSGGNVSCQTLFVSDISQAGLVTFVDAFGVEQAGTQSCCEFYGGGSWFWNAVTERCSTGAVEWEDVPDDTGFRSLGLPNPNLNFDGKQVARLINQDDGQSISYRFRLYAETKGHITTSAHNDRDETRFYVTQNCIASMKVVYVAKVTSLTNFGKMEFGEIDATFRVEDNTVVKVDTDGRIIKNGDASSVSCVVTATYATGAPSFTVDCNGHTGDVLSWSIDVSMLIRPLVYERTGLPQNIVLQNGDVATTQDGSILIYQT